MQNKITVGLENFITAVFDTARISRAEPIQSLWGGYGDLLRLHLAGAGCEHGSVILKHIRLPQPADHPRGWRSDLSHRRKLKSYEVETYWYAHYAKLCPPQCPVPVCLALEKADSHIYLLLSDLTQSGFGKTLQRVSASQLGACLHWLANFHAVFLQHSGEGLWDCGTYWHLDTRPDELAALDDVPLQQAAGLIDAALKQCPYQTLVHGDAKLANFCFADTASAQANPSAVAAVDFQYVGRGCGMKDLVYFLGSCLSDTACQQQQAALLDDYFAVLVAALKKYHPQVDGQDVERQWRLLFDVAWADFHRFLKGWSPGHWKLNHYSDSLTRRVVQRFLGEV